MKVGILSDIHGYSEQLKKALNLFKDCDMILCAGDILYHGPRNPIIDGYNPKETAGIIARNEIPMLIARGNCDADVDIMVLELPVISPVIIYEKDNIRFMVMHGHDADEGRIRDICRIYKVDVMINGHTHIKKCESYLDSLIVNPGSISLPKDGSASVAMYEDGEVIFFDLNSGEVINRYNL